jgi:hypothetical protein
MSSLTWYVASLRTIIHRGHFFSDRTFISKLSRSSRNCASVSSCHVPGTFILQMLPASRHCAPTHRPSSATVRRKHRALRNCTRGKWCQTWSKSLLIPVQKLSDISLSVWQPVALWPDLRVLPTFLL